MATFRTTLPQEPNTNSLGANDLLLQCIVPAQELSYKLNIKHSFLPFSFPRQCLMYPSLAEDDPVFLALLLLPPMLGEGAMHHYTCDSGDQTRALCMPDEHSTNKALSSAPEHTVFKPRHPLCLHQIVGDNYISFRYFLLLWNMGFNVCSNTEPEL